MGIPVMGHLGLTPQAVHRLGLRRQAVDAPAQRLISQAHDSKALDASRQCEHVRTSWPERCVVSSIPVIGIGAGADCDGQVRVTADLLGLTAQQPPFSPALLPGRQLCAEALQRWVLDQRQTATPTTAEPPPEPDC